MDIIKIETPKAGFQPVVQYKNQSVYFFRFDKEETENELRKAKQKEKILQNQITKLTRNARTHRLCTRAGMLESFLPNPELLTDDEVMAVLKIAFHQPSMKEILEKLATESEARKTLTE